MSEVPAAVSGFLQAGTPPAWVRAAGARVPELLNDHANCEKKAAAAALALMFRYPQHDELALQMSRLAREELRHFEQVRRLMRETGVACRGVRPSRYAGALHAACRGAEPGRLVDTLVIGALIEARSCERFALLLPVLPDRVAALYRRLLDSEARHFEVYLALARAAGDDADARVAELGALEARLVTAPDGRFAFHSGAPS